MKEKLTEKTERSLNEPKEIYPSYEEVVVGFVHAQNCSRTQPLAKVEEFPDIDWGGNFTSFDKFVECSECKVRTKFFE